MIVLPPMEIEFARTLLTAAKRDANAMSMAYGMGPESKLFWINTAARIKAMIGKLPEVTEMASAEYLAQGEIVNKSTPVSDVGAAHADSLDPLGDLLG